MSTINLHLCDCMDFMSACKENEFELAICDPDYGLERFKKSFGKTRFKSSKRCGENIILGGKPNNKYFDKLFTCSSYQIIWGANNFTMPETEYFIIWSKEQTVNNFASAEYAWTNCKVPAKVFTFSTNKHNAKKKINIHPTQKPVNLYRWLLQNYAQTGWKIFDSHGGSMSLAIACIEMGFDCTICEKDEDYFNKAVARVKNHCKQLNLLRKEPIINIYK